jgi:hypothetical protein
MAWGHHARSLAPLDPALDARRTLLADGMRAESGSGLTGVALAARIAMISLNKGGRLPAR